MPYRKEKREGKVCVVREKHQGKPQKTMKCYSGSDADARAERYLKALRANVRE